MEQALCSAKKIYCGGQRPAVALAARVRALKVHNALTLRLNVCDVTHLYVGLDTSKYGDMTHSYEGRDIFICGT